MAAGHDLPLAKPRDTVELPSGRMGLVLAVLPEHRREVQYLDSDCDTVVLPVSLLRVVLNALPRPWPKRVL